MVTFETVRQMALALPGVEEGTSYGTPAFRVRGRFLARLKEDGESLVLKLGFDEREALIEAEPEVFYITDHYRGHPSILVRLPKVDDDDFREILEQAWRYNAPKRLLSAYDQTA